MWRLLSRNTCPADQLLGQLLMWLLLAPHPSPPPWDLLGPARALSDPTALLPGTLTCLTCLLRLMGTLLYCKTTLSDESFTWSVTGSIAVMFLRSTALWRCRRDVRDCSPEFISSAAQPSHWKVPADAWGHQVLHQPSYPCPSFAVSAPCRDVVSATGLTQFAPNSSSLISRRPSCFLPANSAQGFLMHVH